jgi:DNA polymerase III gamma/tau subunit
MQLAQKYRPRTFDQVIGQERTIKGLKLYLDSPGDDGQAILLTGPTGSGKTTLAQCAARYWGAAEYDIHLIQSAECDVAALHELDSDMYVHGWNGRKAYILDEVHTVTGRAKDRMLSLLEALPAHVLSIGLTADP